MTAAPISIANAAHYTWGDECDGWHLVRTSGLSVIEERMPPGTSEARHWHARAHQFFYVTAGTLTMEVEGDSHRIPTHAGIELRPGVAHTASNEGDEEVRFLVVSAPPSHGDRHLAEDHAPD